MCPDASRCQAQQATPSGTHMHAATAGLLGPGHAPPPLTSPQTLHQHGVRTAHFSLFPFPGPTCRAASSHNTGRTGGGRVPAGLGAAERGGGLYINSPFGDMGRVVRKIAGERADCLLLAPVWPRWWRVLIDRLPVQSGRGVGYPVTRC